MVKLYASNLCFYKTNYITVIQSEYLVIPVHLLRVMQNIQQQQYIYKHLKHFQPPLQ